MEEKEVMIEVGPLPLRQSSFAKATEDGGFGLQAVVTKSPLLQFGDMRKREVDDMVKDKQTRKMELMMSLLALREKAMRHEEWYKEKKKKDRYKDE